MKNRLIILALGLSPPGTMGGNSKITVEMARCLAGKREVHFILPENKLVTLTDNVPANHGIHIHTLPAFTGEDKLNPIAAIRWFTPRLRSVLREISAGPNDFLYCCSDFHVDVLPPYTLQKEFGFRWLPSVFLFVPFVFENLSRGYKFPAIKYIIYWFYQRALFALMKRRATGFVVTNRSDFARFPKRFANKLFDYYGGVNIEQIPGRRSKVEGRTKDVVFCSRLHPQKGIDAFLDTWKIIVARLRSHPSSPIPLLPSSATAHPPTSPISRTRRNALASPIPSNGSATSITRRNSASTPNHASSSTRPSLITTAWSRRKRSARGFPS